MCHRQAISAQVINATSIDGEMTGSVLALAHGGPHLSPRRGRCCCHKSGLRYCMDDERACDRKCILAVVPHGGDRRGAKLPAVARSPRWLPPNMAALVGLAGACPNGALCEFCHEKHTRSIARRPHKQQRERCLRFIEKQRHTAAEKEV